MLRRKKTTQDNRILDMDPILHCVLFLQPTLWKLHSAPDQALFYLCVSFLARWKFYALPPHCLRLQT